MEKLKRTDKIGLRYSYYHGFTDGYPSRFPIPDLLLGYDNAKGRLSVGHERCLNKISTPFTDALLHVFFITSIVFIRNKWKN